MQVRYKMLNSLKSLYSQKPEYIFLVFFIAFRLVSFLTYEYTLANSLIGFLLIASYLYTSYKNLSMSWLVLIAELILGGSGHYFEVFGLIVRTWFLLIFAIFWSNHVFKTKKLDLDLPRPLTYTFIATILVILYATTNGLIHGHAPKLVLQDTILYFFLFLSFPAIEFKSTTTKHLKHILWTCIIGSALFSLITFFIYSSGIGSLPDTYYHWFRNISAGKITDLGNYFFRIVLSEHLFVVPLILICASLLIADIKNKLYWAGIIVLLTILVLNFTRIYFIAMALGFIILAIKNSFKKWLTVSITSLCIFIILLNSLSFISSRFNSIGLELFGLKISQISAPETDLSGAIRLAMLPDIFVTIQKNPFFGSGLATMVTYPDPLTKELVSRTQFDWGYFEMIAELGSIGTLVFISFIATLLYYLGRLAYSSLLDSKKRAVYQGLFVGAISLFVINITTPALFQGFGILFIVFLMTLINPKDSDGVSH